MCKKFRINTSELGHAWIFSLIWIPTNVYENHVEKKRRNVWKDLNGDKLKILLLYFLYTLQGLPIGLSEAIPLILSNRNVEYEQQAKFSFVYYPFSMKLIWAPIVDSCFLARFGRRKSWLVPAQLMIGEFFYNDNSLYYDRLVC